MSTARPARRDIIFNVRPDKPWFGFYIEPPEDPPRDSSTAFLGYGLGTSAAMPGGTMFSVRPEQDLPGLHNFKPPEEVVPGFRVKPPEEEVPGFRVNADGSIRKPAPLDFDGGANPFGPFDRSRLGTNAFMPAGDGMLPPYLTFARRFYGDLGAVPMADPEAARTDGMPPVEPSSSIPPPASSSSFAGTTTPSLPFDVTASRSFPEQLNPNDGLRPLLASLNSTANPAPISRPHSSVPFEGPIAAEGLPTPDTGLGDAAEPGALPEADGRRPASDRPTDLNIVRVGNRDPGSGETKILQQQAPKPKLQKDPSPGVAVVFPDGSTVADPQSPTGKLMAPVADLSAVAEAGRETREKVRALAVTPIAARLYLAAALGLNLGHGGTFDYQRRGNMITGYTHLQQFEKVSNLNVGLFAQQAGLTLEEVLDIAGTFARNFSDNTDPSQPFGLSATQLKFITRGYQIGESGMFDKPPMR